MSHLHAPILDQRASRQGLPEGFADLDELVYGHDPGAIPEDAQALARAFGPDNPWFDSPGHEALTLCAPGLGRLAVFKPGSLTLQGLPCGFFGYWEAAPDQERAQRALFEQAARWAKAHGLRRLYGPIQFSTYGRYRLRTWAEPQAQTFLGEPYNPPDYGPQLQALGLTRAQGYVTQISDHATLRQVIDQKLTLAQAMHERGYTSHALTPQLWLSRLPELHAMIDAIFGGNFAYTPLSFEAFARACGEPFVARADPQASVMITDPDGALAAFLLVYPDYSPLLVRAAGADRVHPDALRYEQHAAAAAAHGADAAIFKTVGVHPAHRRQGIMDALSASSMVGCQQRYARLIGALIREDNPSRNFSRDHLLFERTYHLYQLDL